MPGKHLSGFVALSKPPVAGSDENKKVRRLNQPLVSGLILSKQLIGTGVIPQEWFDPLMENRGDIFQGKPTGSGIRNKPALMLAPGGKKIHRPANDHVTGPKPKWIFCHLKRLHRDLRHPDLESGM